MALKEVSVDILDIDGKKLSPPFKLGGQGKGLWLEEVRVSNREDAPDSEDYGFALSPKHTGGHPEVIGLRHVIITKPNGKGGVLFRVSAEPDSQEWDYDGLVQLVASAGDTPVLLSRGIGGINGFYRFHDELWHVPGAALFSVGAPGQLREVAVNGIKGTVGDGSLAEMLRKRAAPVTPAAVPPEPVKAAVKKRK